MHVDRAHKITVSRKSASAACPSSILGLVFMPTARTLARRSSFGASKARDMGLFRFVSEIIDIFAIFPQSHTLVVMSATITGAYATRIADEECSHLVLHAKVDDLSRRFMTQITDTTL